MNGAVCWRWHTHTVCAIPQWIRRKITLFPLFFAVLSFGFPFGALTFCRRRHYRCCCWLLPSFTSGFPGLYRLNICEKKRRPGKKWCHTTVWSTLQRTKIEINSFGKQVWPKQRWERVWACVCRLFIQTGWRLTCVHLSWKSVPFNLFPFRFTAAHIWRKWWVLQSCTLTQITQYLCLNKMNEQTPQNNNNTKFNENGNSSE